MESLMFSHQPTWNDCQQLLQVLFTTEGKERILLEARKNVPGANGAPTNLPNEIDAGFPLNRPDWDFNTAADGSSFVVEGKRKTGAAVVDGKQVIWASSLPEGTSVQKAELVALLQALWMAERKSINIYTDSRIQNMESPDRKRQKVLKAKKTMPTSCRKQLEILNKSKNVEVSKATVGINIPNGHNQKKMFSENKENVKLMKASEQINENGCVALERHTALLEQVKHWIRQEIYMINCNLFDKKLNELNERIGKTQCKNKHEAIAGELFVKIRRLQRRIKTVLSSQGDCLEPNTLPNNTVCKVTDVETMNSSVTQKSVKSLSKRMPSVNPDPFKSSEKASARINLSSACVEFVSESNTDDVMLISVEKPHLTTPVTSDSTEIGKNTSRKFSNSPNTRIEAVEKKLDFVIDLTKESLSTCNIESPAFTLKSSSKAVLRSKEIIPVAENGDEGSDSLEHLPPLPEPPPPLPEMADKIQDTLPPQKTELRVKRVLRPPGIALTWNISNVNPKCAPVESYHLFLCYENPHHLTWKKIAEIKALPLPMACTLSQFLASNKYYFTVQSKDIFGRYGPFCNIKSISGFSENLT
ncbi:activating transcription factor 7-interacting protein 2 [Cricetulus griseus]|uniref:Activating transcription factor 7-interacting protein 2 n=1 Tax=Cricetulus griseus TaxID=10029 RepID=A0A061I0C1_CRIGR|nr:activating transcription factor 7-interacting protein 2 [Cricetulus griseus]